MTDSTLIAMTLRKHGFVHARLTQVLPGHPVFTDGMVYIKQHSDPTAFHLEDSLYARLHGGTSSIPGELLLITKNAGEHFYPTSSLVHAMFEELARFHALEIAAPEIDLQKRVYEKLDSRVLRNPAITDDTKQWLDEFVNAKLSFEWHEGVSGLVHTDPHLGNWVKRDGRVSLIDFESVAKGPFAVDAGALIHAFLLRNEIPLATLVRSMYLDRGGSSEALYQGMWLKTSTAFTWCAKNLGENELLKRRDELLPIMNAWECTDS